MVHTPTMLVRQTILMTLAARQGEWLNCYQVAVALLMPASSLVDVLEALVCDGVLCAQGVLGCTNERVYQLAAPAA